jgi:putative spermidine/putrescine transport system permease protein
VVPFFAYAFFFLLLPSAVVILGAFKGENGGFTTKNVSDVINTPQYVHAFQTSLEISALTAGLGGLFGLILAYAAVKRGTPGSGRRSRPSPAWRRTSRAFHSPSPSSRRWARSES